MKAWKMPIALDPPPTHAVTLRAPVQMDTALVADEPGRWETQLRAMRSLLGTCREENAGA